MDGFDHYAYGRQKEYHPQDDTGSVKKQNIESLNCEKSTLLIHTATQHKRHWYPTTKCHTPTVTAHSLRIDTESFLEDNLDCYWQN